MQYAVLIYQPEGQPDGLSDEQRRAVGAEYMALREVPGCQGGAGLEPTTTATTVRMQGEQPMITDGPFADTKEVFAGYYILDADSIDPALEFAQRIPALRWGGAVEIRPVLTPAG